MWQVFRYSDCRVISYFTVERDAEVYVDYLNLDEPGNYGWKLCTITDSIDDLLGNFGENTLRLDQ